MLSSKKKQNYYDVLKNTSKLTRRDRRRNHNIVRTQGHFDSNTTYMKRICYITIMLFCSLDNYDYVS